MKTVKSLIKRIINSIFISLDLLIPKKDNYWVFPVYFIGDGTFSDNMLAVFEKVKNNSQIKKIILTKKKKIIIENGVNVEILKMSSIKTIWLLMRSKIIFVQHSVWLDLSQAKYQIIYPWRRHIINLWHGIVIKDLSHPSTGIINFRSKIEMGKYKIICSSEKDKIIMKKSFYKTDIDNFWITGLPRNDFLVMPERELPKLYTDELLLLKSKIKGKNLIIYTPTYRETNLGGYYYKFSKEEIENLERYLKENNSVLGVRYHAYLQPPFVNELIDDENIIDLSTKVISDVRMLIREASIIITDYSSVYIDAMYLHKKLISFSYDLEHYLKIQRGFYYDFETVFPGEICHTFKDLMKALIKYKNPLSIMEEEKYNKMKKIFFKHIDANNTKRLIDRISSLN